MLRSLICLALFTGLVGCSKQEPTRAEAFRNEQGATVTPHGRIILESVKESELGVSYETIDNTKWNVRMEKAADGQYRYGEPDQVKDSK